MKQKQFNIGDKVFDIRYGWGVVHIIKDITQFAFPIVVGFKDFTSSYTFSGKETERQINSSLSHTEYGPNIQQQPVFPRVMEISSSGKDNDWVKRVAIGIINNEVAVIYGVDSFDKIHEGNVQIHFWKHYREVEEETIVELTLEDISAGKGVGIPAHLLRIKK